jgi:hypothetical protein
VSGPFYGGVRFLNPEGRYFLYEPAAPKPAEAPVVLFLHGYQALTPSAYQGWIDHMVRKGFVVVWVRYQAVATLPPAFADNAMKAWKDALDRLGTGTHVRPLRDGAGAVVSAMVGHSAGGYLSAILAARAVDPANGIPSPRAIVAIEPGRVDLIPGADLGAIPPTTRMVVVVGDEDDQVCKATAVAIWQATSQIPDANRDFLLVLADRHGDPAQPADHFFPTTGGQFSPLDARDFFVTFKLSVAALNCAFSGKQCKHAFGGGAARQVDMGAWSDGTPVTPMVWVADPSALDTTCQDP